MKKGKYNAEQLLLQIMKLGSVEFLGVCKILDIPIYEETKEEESEEKELSPRSFYDIWCDMCDTVEGLNRVKRRNLGKLIYPATKEEK